MWTDEDLKQLVRNPREALDIELKAWIDLSTNNGKAKIAKACMALKNQNGGVLLIGFDDKTRQPTSAGMPSNVDSVYHQDAIQRIVSSHSSIQFEIDVRFVERDGVRYPAIVVGSGVKTPVAAKKELKDEKNDHILIKEDHVYVRSLLPNNTLSTAPAMCGDWERLVSTCMDNRETDIAGFLRRHFRAGDASAFLEALIEVTKREQGRAQSPSVTSESCPQEASGTQIIEALPAEVSALLDKGFARFCDCLSKKRDDLAPYGTWETALILEGNVPTHRPNQTFLGLIMSSNPHYTGWPLWIDSRDWPDADDRPQVVYMGWQSLVTSTASEWSRHLDFWRIEPCGRFYHLRALEDDMGGPHRPEPRKVLDPLLVVWRVSEAIAVGKRFASAMGCAQDGTGLHFGFRWKDLVNRRLDVWATPGGYLRGLRHTDSSEQPEVTATVTVPMQTADSAIFQYVSEATQPLFEIFGGYELDLGTIENAAREVLRIDSGG